MVDPEVGGGGPCIRGYRMRVKDVLEPSAAGAMRREIIEDYAFLEDADITAVLDRLSRHSRRGVTGFPIDTHDGQASASHETCHLVGVAPIGGFVLRDSASECSRTLQT